MNSEETKQELLQSISIIESETLLEKLQLFLKATYEADRLTAVQLMELNKSGEEVSEGKSTVYEKTGLLISPTAQKQLDGFSEVINEKLKQKTFLLEQYPEAGRLYDAKTETRVLPLFKEISIYYVLVEGRVNFLAFFESKKRPNRVPKKMQ